MLDGVWGEQPASCVDSHHAGSDGGTSDEPDWWHFMPSMFQYLPVHMHWEYLWLWAHTHQMYTHRGIGAHADIWKEKRKLWVSLWFLHLFLQSIFFLYTDIHTLAFTTQFHQQCHCSWKYCCGQKFWQWHKGLLVHFATCSFWMIKSLWLFFSLS